MLILLPPSEGKTAARRGRPYDPADLSFPELGEQRSSVRAALESVGAGTAAAKSLGVPAGSAGELERNVTLATAASARADRVYTGVLYDALDLASLDAAARRRAGRRIVIVSALYGAVRPQDRIAAYRLSMGASLPGLGRMSSAWRPHLDAPLSAAAGRGIIVDARSADYVAAWRPSGELAQRWVHIAVPGATHMAKHTRGLVARALCESPDDPRTPQGLADLLAPAFTTALIAPERPGKPWTLQVNAR